MKKWPWRRIITIVACALVLVGVAPITYLLWFGYTTNWTPLTMPLPLKVGSYTSPSFKTSLHDKDKPYWLVVVADEFTTDKTPPVSKAERSLSRTPARAQADGSIWIGRSWTIREQC